MSRIWMNLCFDLLPETFTLVESSSGYVDVYDVALDCGCDEKWIIEDFPLNNDSCHDGTYLEDVR